MYIIALLFVIVNSYVVIIDDDPFTRVLNLVAALGNSAVLGAFLGSKL